MKTLKGKTVIITGGSRGIGKACVEAFSKAGANVVFTFNKSRKEAMSAKKLGKNVLPVQADVKDYEQCRAVVLAAQKKFKSIDFISR